MLFSLLILLAPFAARAHFLLNYPPSREFDEDKQSTFPCGGSPEVGIRTDWHLGGAPIQIDTTHTSSRYQVLMALGNDPGSNFNVILVPTFQETGPENFCFGSVTIPAELNVTAGMNATIQVISSGDGVGGLYNCADITFVDAPLSTDQYATNCKNSTGQTVSAISGPAVNANGTKVASGSTSSNSSESTPSAAAPASTSSGAAVAYGPVWVVGGLGFLGSLALL